MIKHAKIPIIVALAVVLLIGCTNTQSPTPIYGLEQTLAVRTLVATMGVSYFATLTPTPSPTSPEQPTDASLPFDGFQPATSTMVPSLTPFQNSLFLEAVDETCQNNAEFVQDVTVEDQSKMKAGQKFTKIWRLRNTGTCTWTPDYAVVFTFGDKLGGESPKPLGVEVQPGETVDIALDMLAPKTPDNYSGNWMLQDDQGNIFGCGSSRRNFFWVSIVVGGGPRSSIYGGFCGGGG